MGRPGGSHPPIYDAKRANKPGYGLQGTATAIRQLIKRWPDRVLDMPSLEAPIHNSRVLLTRNLRDPCSARTYYFWGAGGSRLSAREEKERIDDGHCLLRGFVVYLAVKRGKIVRVVRDARICDLNGKRFRLNRFRANWSLYILPF